MRVMSVRGFSGQVLVGDHRRLGDPGVDHDEAGRFGPMSRGAMQRVVVGHVGAEEHHEVGVGEVVVAAGGAVAAEGELVAGGRRGHAQRGVAVVVGEPQAEADQLAEGVELLGHELAGRQHRDALGPVLVEEPR